MKYKIILTKVLWAVAVMLALPLSALSQSWTASPVGNGTFYLYNVSEGKFLTAGTTYTTRASLTTQGGVALTFTAVDESNGIYAIATTPTFNDNLTLGVGTNDLEAYLDVQKNATNASNWKFIPVEGETDTYLIQSVKNSKYMVAHASKTDRTSVTSTSVPTTSKGYWKLVTKEALIANLENATEANPIDVTFAIENPFFAAYARTSLWSGDYTAYNGVDDNKCIEQFNRTFDMYQTITGLPNGVYKLRCQGFYRMGGGSNNASAAAEARTNGNEVLNAKYYINSTEGSLKSIFDYSLGSSYNSNYNTSSASIVNGVNIYVPNNLNRASNCFLAGEYWNEPIKAVVTDGIIKIGFRKTITSTNDWTAYDNVTLTYCGIDLSALVEDYNQQLAIARGLLSQPMQTSVKSALSDAITAAETNVDLSSQSWLESTLSLLGTAISNAQASHALYMGDILKAVNGMKAQSTSDDVKAAVQQKYDDGEYSTAADVYAYYQPLEIAALPATDNTVYTSAIINPGFELGNTDGWAIVVMGEDTGARSTSSSTYSNTKSEGNYLFNSWANSVMTLDVGQTVTGLPNGYYTLEAVVAGYGDKSPITMTANGKSASCMPENSNVDAEVANGHELTLERILVSDGTLAFKVQNTGKGKTLLKADNFRLTLTESYAGLASYTDLSLSLNIENDEVARYLANTTYTETTATVIGNYNTDASARNDQPATIMVPLPAQESESTLTLALNDSYTDGETFTVPAASVLYEVKNLLPRQTYYYKVENGSTTIASGTITTTGQLRMIKADGIANMRDLGGWTNSDGNKIRYGKLFRGSELRGGGTYTASDADLAMLKDQLNIGAEVDLRLDAHLSNGVMSGSAIDGATYYYANTDFFSEDALNLDAEKYNSAFSLILAALRQDKAAYFHCIFGADRTGCFAFLIEGLLGLPVDQLYKDYELTSFSSAGVRDKTGIDHKLQYIKALPGNNLQEQFYNYWRGAVGISESDLNDFINIMVDSTSTITTATLEPLPAKAVADGDYYIYLPTIGKFLGRGRSYGTQGVPDNYGVPATIKTSGAGVTTVRFLDNELNLGSDGMTDKADNYNSVSWTLEHRDEDLVMKSHNGKYLYIKEGTRVYVDGAVEDAIPVAFKTAAEQKAIVAATQQANILSAAAAAGIAAGSISAMQADLSEKYVALPSKAVLKGANTKWTLKEPNAHGETANYGNAYNIGNYGAELYQKNATVSQTVTMPHAGLYKLSFNALYRQGSKELCYAAGQKGFDAMSNAYVSVNDTYFAQIPSWYSDCKGAADPDNTSQAKALMDDGKYPVELYFYVGNDKQATFSVNVPGFVSRGWCIFNDFKLTDYALKVQLSENATEAPEAVEYASVTAQRTIAAGKWATLCLPFALDKPDGWDVRELKSLTTVGEVSTLHFEPVGTLEAGKPYMVKTTEAVSTITADGVSIISEPVATTADGASMVGVFKSGNIPAGYYFVSDNKFYQAEDASNTIRAFRAYFRIEPIQGVRDIVISYDEANGIGAVSLPATPVRLYNLSGRRQSVPQRGINIVRQADGSVRKVIMK